MKKYRFSHLQKLNADWAPLVAVVKNLPANAGNTGLISGPEHPTCFGETKPVRHSY